MLTRSPQARVLLTIVGLLLIDVGTADVHSRRTLMLERRGGRWLIVHLHASNVRP